MCDNVSTSILDVLLISSNYTLRNSPVTRGFTLNVTNLKILSYMFCVYFLSYLLNLSICPTAFLNKTDINKKKTIVLIFYSSAYAIGIHKETLLHFFINC